MSRAVFHREEFLRATLHLGTTDLALADYQTTGLRIVAVAPSGAGKTNAGLLVAEQLAAQGWVSVLMDPEGEMAALYGPDRVMRDVAHFEAHLRGRHHPLLVLRVRRTSEFLEYGRALMRIVDEARQPVFLLVDEGQIFSTSRRSKQDDELAQASDLLNDITERGRKRALDLFVTAHRFSGTLSRSLFQNKNITFVGRQEDPTAWSALAPQFRGSGITFRDLAALAPGEFFCFSRRGVEKVVMPMAEALAKVAPKASIVRPAVPQTFSQWDRAVREIPDDRLLALDRETVAFLAAAAPLAPSQLTTGMAALEDELQGRG